MLTMPIARREMLVLARSPATYRARLATGLVTLVGGIAFGIFYSRAGIGGVFPFIGVLGYMLSMMCMFTGAQVSADSVSKEKREGTLGLLFMSGLSGGQIAGGKLIAAGLSAFFGIMVTFPLLSLVLIAGGVMPLQILLIALTLLNTLFVSASMGLYISTTSLEQKRASGRASTMVMIFWWGLPMLARASVGVGAPAWVSSAFLLFSLNSSYVPIMPGVGLGNSTSPPLNLLCLHILGWFFFGLAAWNIRRQWQDKPERTRFSVRAYWKRLSFGNARVRERLRTRLLERNPFLWLAARDRLRALGMWIVTLIMLGVSAFIYYAGARATEPLLGFTVAVTFIHRFMAVSLGAGQLLAEQEQGTLEMLLSTPLRARDLLAGQFDASFRQLRGPALLVVLLHLTTGALIYREHHGLPAFALIILSFSAAFYLFDLYCAVWLSMWGAVISQNPKHASGAAISRLFGVPFVVTSSGTVLLAFLNTFYAIGVHPTLPIIVASICLLIVGNNLYWLGRIRRELPERLRSYAFRRYAPDEERGAFAQLGKSIGRAYGNYRRRQVQESTLLRPTKR